MIVVESPNPDQGPQPWHDLLQQSTAMAHGPLRSSVRRESVAWSPETLASLCLATVEAADETLAFAEEEARRGRPGLGPLPEPVAELVAKACSPKTEPSEPQTSSPLFSGAPAARTKEFSGIVGSPYSGLDDEQLDTRSQLAMERWEALQRIRDAALDPVILAALEAPTGPWAVDRLGTACGTSLRRGSFGPELTSAEIALGLSVGVRLLNARWIFVESLGEGCALPAGSGHGVFLEQASWLLHARAQRWLGRNAETLKAHEKARSWEFNGCWAIQARVEAGTIIANLQGWAHALPVIAPGVFEAWRSRNRRAFFASLGSMAAIYWEMGDAPAFRRVLEYCTEQQTPLGHRSADAMGILRKGIAAFGGGEVDRAEKDFQTSLEMYRELGNSRNQGMPLGFLALVHQMRGEPDLARDKLDQALQVFRDIGDRLYQGLTLCNLGSIAILTGAPDQARDAYAQALELQRLQGNRMQEAFVRLNLGNLHLSTGSPPRARKDFEAALALFLEGRVLQGEGYTRLNLANMDIEENRWSDAETSLKQVTAIGVELGDRYLQGAGHLELSLCYRQTDRLDQAQAAIQESLTLFRGQERPGGLQGDRRVGVGRALRQMADLQIQRQDFVAALSHATEAVQVLEAQGDTNELWKAQYLLARCRVRNALPATQVYAQALETLESWAGAIGAEQPRTSVLEFSFSLVQDAVAHLLGPETQEPIDPEQAFEVADRSKAQSLRQSLRARSGQVPIPAHYAQRRRDIEGRLRALQDLLLAEGPSTSSDSERAQFLGRQLARTKREHAEILDDIAFRFPLYATEELLTETMSIADVQSRIVTDSRSALLEYFVTKSETYVWIVRHTQWELLRLGLGGPELSGKVAPLVGAMQRGDASFLTVFPKTLRELARDVLDPILPRLDGVERLRVVRSGPLHEVPFEMLVLHLPEGLDRSGGAAGGRFAAPEYAVERFEFSYGPSATLFDPQLEVRRDSPAPHAPPPTAPISLVALGDPAYPAAPSAGAAARNRRSLERLPGTRRELETLKQLFPDGQIFSGEEAREANYRRFAPAAQIIHLGCHGVVDRDRPEYSGIILSAGDGAADDAYLQAYELSDIELSHRPLVVLSACDVAGGRVSPSEGLMGLTRAFTRAGAGVVVASAWKADDEATADLMAAFYGHLTPAQISPAAALTRAKREILSRARSGDLLRRNGAHPFFWAGFQTFGLSRSESSAPPAPHG